jgi:YD repeat-containing protein
MTQQLHRRAAISGLVATGVGGFITSAFATDTTQYWYDALGRVVRVQFQNGSTVAYTYDAAGNRTVVARTSSPPSTVFTATIPITGTAPVNLHSLAVTAGYDGSKDANVTFTLASGVTIAGVGGSLGDVGGPGIDVGAWPITQHYIALALQITGTVYGGGGSGGEGDGNTGGQGGDAISCTLPMSITVNTGGVVKSGGGGGGGGLQSPPPLQKFGGGGGGGGAPNGQGGAGGTGNPTSGHNGQNGTTSGGGAGGAGAGAGATAGGTGGTLATDGSQGVSGGANGGSAGYAIRKNGFVITVTNNGTISGTVG